MTAYIAGPVTVVLAGDRATAERYIEEGYRQRGLLRSIYGVHERLSAGEPGGFFHRTVQALDGTLIQVITNNGQDTIRITAPARQVPARATPAEIEQEVVSTPITIRSVRPTMIVGGGAFPWYWIGAGQVALTLPPGYTSATPVGVSDDGRVIVGSGANNDFTLVADVVWNSFTPSTPLRDALGEDTGAVAVSASGARIVGNRNIAGVKTGVLMDSGVVSLLTGPADTTSFTAVDISSDGRTIVGTEQTRDAPLIALTPDSSGDLYVSFQITSRKALLVKWGGASAGDTPSSLYLVTRNADDSFSETLILSDAVTIWNIFSGGYNGEHVIFGANSGSVPYFYWSPSTGVVELGTFPTFVPNVLTYIAVDGTEIWGTAGTPGGDVYFHWTVADGFLSWDGASLPTVPYQEGAFGWLGPSESYNGAAPTIADPEFPYRGLVWTEGALAALANPTGYNNGEMRAAANGNWLGVTTSNKVPKSYVIVPPTQVMRAFSGLFEFLNADVTATVDAIDVSSDGAKLVYVIETDEAWFYFYRASGIDTALPASFFPSAMSRDGEIVVGQLESGNAAYWTPTGGLVDLGFSGNATAVAASRVVTSTA